MPLIEIDKPSEMAVPETANSASELLRQVAAIAKPEMAVAIVLIDTEGNYHTYKFSGVDEDLLYSATALNEWYQQLSRG